MKKILLFSFILLIPIVSALPLYVKPLSADNETQGDTYFTYNFSLTTDDGCTNVIRNKTVTLLTLPDGIGFYEFDTLGLPSIPRFVCEERDSSYRTNHTIPDVLARTVYATEVQVDGNVSAANLTATDTLTVRNSVITGSLSSPDLTDVQHNVSVLNETLQRKTNNNTDIVVNTLNATDHINASTINATSIGAETLFGNINYHYITNWPFNYLNFESNFTSHNNTLTDLQTNASAQSKSISDLWGNASTQSKEIEAINGSIDDLWSNATAQSKEIEAINSSIDDLWTNTSNIGLEISALNKTVVGLDDLDDFTDSGNLYQDDIGNDCAADNFVKGVDDDGTLDCAVPTDVVGINNNTDIIAASVNITGGLSVKGQANIENLNISGITVAGNNVNMDNVSVNENLSVGANIVATNNITGANIWATNFYGNIDYTYIQNWPYDYTNYEANFTSHNNTLTDLQTNASAQSKEIEAINGSIDDLWTNTSNIGLEISALNKTIAGLSAFDSSAMVANITNNTDTIQSYNNTLTDLQTNASTQSKEIEAINGSIAGFISTALQNNTDITVTTLYTTQNTTMTRVNVTDTLNASNIGTTGQFYGSIDYNYILSWPYDYTNYEANFTEIINNINANFTTIYGNLNKNITSINTTLENLEDTALTKANQNATDHSVTSIYVANNATIKTLNLTDDANILDDKRFYLGTDNDIYIVYNSTGGFGELG